MKRLIPVSLLLALFFFMAPSQANAQIAVEVGPRLGIDVGDVEEFFIGADARITSPALPVAINPAFDYYFVDIEGYSIFTVDVNALYEFGVNNQAFTPYAGGGIGILRQSVDVNTGFGTASASNTDVGLNLVGGAKFEAGPVEPFVQAKINVGGDFTLFNLMGGLLFSL